MSPAQQVAITVDGLVWPRWRHIWVHGKLINPLSLLRAADIPTLAQYLDGATWSFVHHICFATWVPIMPACGLPSLPEHVRPLMPDKPG